LVDAEVQAALPAGVEDAYPVSQTQLGMLYHSERERAHSAYHDIMTHTVQLRFDEAALRQAWQALVARHAILRTAFDMERYGEPLQLVYRDALPALAVEHQQGWSVVQRQASLTRWMAQEKAQGFDWQRPGLLRGQVFVHKDTGFVLGLSFHHAILDGWSTSILMRDLTQLYQAALADVSVELPVMASAYRDYIGLEQAALHDNQTLDHWQGVLATLQPTRILSQDDSRGQGVERAMVPVSIEETAQAKALAASLGVSLKSVLLAIHFKALSSLSGEAELSTGVVTNGRPESLGGESLLGLFLNSLPLSARVPSGSWLDWIKALSKQEQALWSHRRYPMATLKREYGGDLFQTLFNYTHFRAYATQAADGESLLFGRGAEGLEAAGFEHSNYGFILQAGLTPDSEQIYLMLEVDHEQYSKADLTRAVGLYRRCLSQLLAGAEGRCDEPLLDSAEVEQLSQWQGEGADVTDDVWSLFEQQ
ncbi:condensation domain-containing protein, partial [Rheinheimera gaetbuli]